MSSDRIEKTTVIRAPRSQVWRAITTAEDFGAWFGAKVTGAFVPGARISGPITTPGYEHFTLTMQIERVEPEQVFAYRWHPYAIEPGVDYSKEPSTLVEFRLDDAAEGTRLTVVESGFDKLPAARRDLAFRMNEGGWAAQIKNVERYVTGKAGVAN
jgi:uncharacterized protein YndB with AHSA1/START domain